MSPLHTPAFGDRSPESIAERDDRLAAGIRLGDEEACGALYRAYRQPLWELAYSYARSAAVAEELVHDVFLALWRGRASWEVRESVRAWLFASVRNRALNHLRHERVAGRVGSHAMTEEAVPAMGSRPAGADADVEAGELEAAIREAVSALPERRRAAMLLRWQHDLSAAEIAKALGTSPESVRVLLTRARQELATFLERFRRNV